MYSFEKDEDWTAPISRTSTQERFQTATIRIEDWSFVQGEYDVDTDQYEYENPEDAIVYEGRARIIGIGRSQFNQGDDQANATSIVPIRIQIPNITDAEGYGDDEYGDDYSGGIAGRIKRGVKVFVLSSPRNPGLEGLIFTVTSDIQGSSAAARTFEAAYDMDSGAQNA